MSQVGARRFRDGRAPHVSAYRSLGRRESADSEPPATHLFLLGSGVVATKNIGGILCVIGHKNRPAAPSAASAVPTSTRLPHRHGDAFVYAYVLEGTVRSQLDHQPVPTFHQGDNWVEEPGAHHVLTENTSSTQRARLPVVFVSHTEAKLKVNDPH